MRILITGADLPLGQLAVSALASEHELRLTGSSPELPSTQHSSAYTPADLRDPAQVTPLLEGARAVLHLAPHARRAAASPHQEGDLLDEMGRGTYVLLRCALAAGVERVILASRLDVLSGYPPEYVVDENWKPRPAATAPDLAPFLAELTLRELVRAQPLVGICFRFGDLGEGTPGTTPEDAVAALTAGLRMELPANGYRWWLYHVDSSGRYARAHAEVPPLSLAGA